MFVKNNQHRYWPLLYKNLDLFLLFLIAIFLAINIPGPTMLGLWESLYYFHTYGAAESSIDFLISPRANIGDPGYFLIDISRVLIEIFRLNLKLETFRIPSIVFGILTLLVFQVYCRRYFSRTPAFLATLLLCVNPMFQQQQHTMTVLVISGFSFLFVLERLQKIEINYYIKNVWFGYTLSLVILAFQYGVARIISLIYFIYWTGKNLFFIRKTNLNKKNSKYYIFQRCIFFLFIAQCILILCDFSNVTYIVRPDLFFFPKSAEISLISSGYNSISAGLLESIYLNSKILLESIFLTGSNYHSNLSVYRAFDFRSPIMFWPIIPFFISGFAISLRKISSRSVMLQMPWQSTIIIFTITLIPCIFSSVFIGYENLNGGFMSTLSNHRMYFILFPIYIFVAIFFSFIINNFGKYYSKQLAIIITLAIFLYSISYINKQNQIFDALVSSSNDKINGDNSYLQWLDGEINYDRDIKNASHIQQHLQYIKTASIIKEHLLLNKSKYVIINLDIKRFSESLVSPYALHYIKGKNYHTVFLNLYLANLSVKSNWILVGNIDGARSTLGFTRPRLYSADMKLRDISGDYEYINPNNLTFLRLMGSNGLDADKVIVTTTNIELNYAQNYLYNKNLDFKIVNIK